MRIPATVFVLLASRPTRQNAKGAESADLSGKCNSSTTKNMTIGNDVWQLPETQF